MKFSWRDLREEGAARAMLGKQVAKES